MSILLWTDFIFISPHEQGTISLIKSTNIIQDSFFFFLTLLILEERLLFFCPFSYLFWNKELPIGENYPLCLFFLKFYADKFN